MLPKVLEKYGKEVASAQYHPFSLLCRWCSVQAKFVELNAEPLLDFYPFYEFIIEETIDQKIN